METAGNQILQFTYKIEVGYNAYFEIFGNHGCTLKKITVQGKGIKTEKLIIKESKMRSIVCDYTNKNIRLPEYLILSQHKKRNYK